MKNVGILSVRTTTVTTSQNVSAVLSLNVGLFLSTSVEASFVYFSNSLMRRNRAGQGSTVTLEKKRVANLYRAFQSSRDDPIFTYIRTIPCVNSSSIPTVDLCPALYVSFSCSKNKQKICSFFRGSLTHSRL